jgi:hypothetical protein
MWFDSLDAVRSFAGEDYEVAVVPAKPVPFSNISTRATALE